MLNRATAPPMPDALTARIQAALATEAAARAADAPKLAAAVAVPGAATPGTPGHNGSQGADGQDRTKRAAGSRTGWRGHDRSWLALRVAAVTAAVAVIAGGGYGVSQLLTGSPAVTGRASGAGTGAGPAIRIKGPVAGGLNPASGPASSPGTGSSARSGTGTFARPGDQQRHELPASEPRRPSQFRPRKSEPPCPLKRAPRTNPGPLAEPGKPLPPSAVLPDTHRQRPAPTAGRPGQIPRAPSPDSCAPVHQRRPAARQGRRPRLHRHRGQRPSHSHPPTLRLGPAPEPPPAPPHPRSGLRPPRTTSLTPLTPVSAAPAGGGELAEAFSRLPVRCCPLPPLPRRPPQRTRWPRLTPPGIFRP